MTRNDATPETGLRLERGASMAATLDRAAAMLRAAGIDSARLDARLIVAAATGWTREKLLVEAKAIPDAAAFEAIEAMIDRRVGREPLAQILRLREFWSLPFRVTPDVLTPRPESETLVEAVLEWTKQRRPPAAILDLGTGSGCLLLALLHEFPRATGLGIDRSPAALEVAAANARRARPSMADATVSTPTAPWCRGCAACWFRADWRRWKSARARQTRFRRLRQVQACSPPAIGAILPESTGWF